jgi:hypothetical protein
MAHKYYNAVTSLMEETLEEDPVDIGLLPIDEEVAKKLVITSMCEHWDSLQKNCENNDDLAITALTVMSKLAYENFVLHIQINNNSKF